MASIFISSTTLSLCHSTHANREPGSSNQVAADLCRRTKILLTAVRRVFFIVAAAMAWRADADCEGVTAQARAQWLSEHQGLSPEQAQQQVGVEGGGGGRVGGRNLNQGVSWFVLSQKRGLQPNRSKDAKVCLSGMCLRAPTDS